MENSDLGYAITRVAAGIFLFGYILGALTVWIAMSWNPIQ